jgi:hypothetical protein
MMEIGSGMMDEAALTVYVVLLPITEYHAFEV